MRNFLLIIIFGFAALLTFNGMTKVRGKIVCFGDSITYGAQVNRHSWVYYLTKEHKGSYFINAGRNGRKTSDKEELLPVLNKYYGADYFLIFLGVNDLKNGNENMVNNCVNNVDWMIEKIKQKNEQIKIVILSPCNINLKTMSKLNIQKKYNSNTKESLFLSVHFFVLFFQSSNQHYSHNYLPCFHCRFSDHLHREKLKNNQHHNIY